MPGEHVSIIKIGEKTIYLLGTAHVSSESADEAYELIKELRPDSVCVELDADRLQSIKNEDHWKNTDIISVIKQKKSAFLLVNIILSAYQKRLADKFDISAGQEMINSIHAAEEIDAKVIAVDRSLKTTFLRIWRKLRLWDKMKLLYAILFSFAEDEEITQEDLEQLKKQDMLESALSELSESFPSLKKYLVDERDIFLSQSIKNAPGNLIVAVVGAAHTPGINKMIYEDIDISEIDTIPPPSKITKAAGWLIPVLIVLMILLTFTTDFSSGFAQMKKWFIYTSTLSALGTMLAGGHPLSVFVAFIAAPLTTLHPLLASGWFAGLAEAYVRKPKVSDFEQLSTDLTTFKGLWKNKLTRILLVVVLSNIGSSIGMYLGGIEIFVIFKNLFMK